MRFFLFFYLVFLVQCKTDKEVIHAKVQDITESVYASGMIVSQNQYEVFATATGIIQEIFVEENGSVLKGTPLLRIKSEAQGFLEKNARLAYDFNEVAANKGKIEDAKRLVELAKIKKENDVLLLERQRDLWSQGIGSKFELEQKELALKNAEVNYANALERYDELVKQLTYLEKQARNNWSISQNSKDDFTVKSMIKGKVYQYHKSKGEMVSPQTSIAIIGDDQNFILEMQVDEYDIIPIKLGMQVMVVLNSYKDKVYEAKITKINPIMQSQTKTFTVEAEFVERPEVLYPHISFEANIVLKSKKSALLIPRDFLLNDSTVINDRGENIKVITGLKDYQMIEIISGIDTNDALIRPSK